MSQVDPFETSFAGGESGLSSYQALPSFGQGFVQEAFALCLPIRAIV